MRCQNAVYLHTNGGIIWEFSLFGLVDRRTLDNQYFKILATKFDSKKNKRNENLVENRIYCAPNRNLLKETSKISKNVFSAKK